MDRHMPNELKLHVQENKNLLSSSFKGRIILECYIRIENVRKDVMSNDYYFYSVMSQRIKSVRRKFMQKLCEIDHIE